MSAAPVEVRALTKHYGEITAVDHVDLTVEAGDVYGYLGPNGAGKTTSLRMMLGLIRPNSGSVRLFGRDPQLGVAALEGVAGFVEAPRFYPYLTGRKNLELLAAFDGGDAESRIGEVLDVVELTPRAGDRVGGYSHGMRQRLGIAAALLRSPRLLLLDEPTTGLDPAGMRDMRLLVRRLADSGITVLLSSHQLGEVEEMCNRVAIVQAGRIVYEGALAELTGAAVSGYRLRTTDPARALTVCRAQPGIEDAHLPEGAEEVTFMADDEAAAGLSVALVEAGVAIVALVPQRPTLEDLFFRFTEGDGDAPSARRKSSPRWVPHEPRGSDRLPLGAPQAPLSEAHLPRAGGRRGGSADLRRRHRSPQRRARGRGLRALHPRHRACRAAGAPALRSDLDVPLITALVAGDIVAAEDHNGTLKTILTRSLERGQIFAGKALATATYAIAAILLMGAVALVAGSLESGFNPIVSLSGTTISAGRGLVLVGASLLVYLMPIMAVACIGLLLSTVTRNSAAAVVGTLMFSLLVQLIGILPGLGGLHPYLLSTQFNAWQGCSESRSTGPPSCGPLGCARSTASPRSWRRISPFCVATWPAADPALTGRDSRPNR